MWFALVREPFATKTFKKVQSSSCTFSRNPFEALATVIYSTLESPGFSFSQFVWENRQLQLRVA